MRFSFSLVTIARDGGVIIMFVEKPSERWLLVGCSREAAFALVGNLTEALNVASPTGREEH